MLRPVTECLCVLFVALATPVGAAGQSPARTDSHTSPPFDLLLTNARVMDGTGNPWFRADVGIRKGRIVAVGRLAKPRAKRTIDLHGRVLAPGFIDLHSHADRALGLQSARRRAAASLVTQGITTVVVNQDGRSPAPIKAQRARYTDLGIGPNAVLLVGHGTVRRRVMRADHRRAATQKEILSMVKHVAKAIRDGAYGMSAGLEYVPGRWSTTEEIVALVREVAKVDGVYIAHERSSGTRPMWYLPSQDPLAQPSMLDNIQELIRVSESTGAAVVATHIKVKGTDFWGSSGAIIQLINRARSRGVRIYADQYPYNTSGTDGRVVLLPRWLYSEFRGDTPAAALEKALKNEPAVAKLRMDVAHEIMRRGGADQVVIIDHPDRSLIGQSIQAIADRRRASTFQIVLDLQLRGFRKQRGGARMRGFSMSEDDVEALGAQEWTATASDGGVAMPEDGLVHPRYYGTFARKIRHYAMHRRVISISHAIRSSTSLPAQILGFRDRGQVREGFHADLVVLDLDRVRDKATAFKPHQFSEGFDYVLIGGKFVVEEGKPTGALPGTVIIKEK